MKETKYPRVHLVIDNCFAIKRWVKPRDWMQAVKQIGGVSLIQASTDNEIDPTHNTQDFRDDWVSEVKQCENEMGLKVVSFYSGYAEYRTVGIASHAESKRNTMIECYFEPTVDIAARLDAQVGNTLSAFSDPVLQDPKQFAQTDKYIEDSLVRMTKYAAEKNVLFGYEQMYSPTQGMWTINGCADCMKKVTARANAPMYITVDTAHQAGQHLFLKPSVKDIEVMQSTGSVSGFRLPKEILDLIAKNVDAEQIHESLEKYSYWFAQSEDSDVYEWFSRLGCYSPIVHLQQTDGTYSSHKPFTKKFNDAGIIHPKDVFAAIKRSYDVPIQEGMPPKVSDIYLAFEVFFGITDTTDTIIDDMRESVAYWRESIPRDGMCLDELV